MANVITKVMAMFIQTAPLHVVRLRNNTNPRQYGKKARIVAQWRIMRRKEEAIMPKAKTGSVPGTSTKAIESKVKTEAAKAETGFIPVDGDDGIISLMIRHNCVKENVDGFNPNAIYAVLVLDRYNFVNEYTTFERSYLISSSSPFFKCRFAFDFHAKKDREGNPISTEIYGDCLDRTLDQGVRLDWYKWVYEGGYFYDPATGTMLQYDAKTREVKPLSKKAVKITEQTLHEALLASRLGPAYKELRSKPANIQVIDAGMATLVAKLEGQKDANLDTAALKAVLDGLTNACEKAAAEREKAKKSEKAVHDEEGKKISREINPENLRLLIKAKYSDRLKVLPSSKAAVAKAKEILTAMAETWAKKGLKEIDDEFLAETILVIEREVKAIAEKEAIKSKPKAEEKKPEPPAEPKAEPKAEKPEGEKAKSKGPSKTSKQPAKPAQGKATSFPVPVKRGKK